MNWYTLFIWTQIVHARKPWRPQDIVQEAKKLNPATFTTLTKQVVSCWINKEAKEEKISCWSEETMKNIAKGNSPGGEATQTGILVCLWIIAGHCCHWCLLSGTVSHSLCKDK